MHVVTGTFLGSLPAHVFHSCFQQHLQKVKVVAACFVLACGRMAKATSSKGDSSQATTLKLGGILKKKVNCGKFTKGLKAMKALKKKAPEKEPSETKVNKKPFKKPARFEPPPGEPMTLDEKIEMFVAKGKKTGSLDIGSFLDELPDEQRQALWPRKTMKNQELDKVWKDNCTGPGSTENKHKMLGIFLKAGGQIKNSQAYFQEMSKISKETGTKSSEEWVPFETIKLRFGLAELSRRIQRGTIVARKAEDDENEYEFRVVKKIAYSDQSTKEEMKGHTTGKMEVDQWLKLKAQTMNSFSSSSGDAMNALCLNAPQAGGQNKRKGTPSNKQASEEAEDSGMEEDPDVFKAEQLSDAGSVKIKTAEKLNNMHRLLTKVMKETVGKARKILIAPTQQLDKLKASKKQLKFEEIKGVLFDCAMAVKQAKKMNEA